MSERYKRIKVYDERLWSHESPIIINKSALIRDEVKEINILQVQLENAINKVIIAVDITIDCLNISGDIIEEKNFTYLDLHIPQFATFGDQTPISLENVESREFRYKVKKVYWEDGTSSNKDILLNPIANTQSIDNLGNLKSEFLRELKINHYTFKSKYIPQFEKDYWYCTCGTLNETDNKECVFCGIKCEKLMNISSLENLKKNSEEFIRKEDERWKEDARKQEEINETMRIKKNKLIMTCSIVVSPIIIVILIVTIWTINNKIISKKYMDKVDILGQGDVVIYQSVKDLETEYHNLTDRQRKLVTNYEKVESYLVLNFDIIRDIQSDINNALSQYNVSYKTLNDIEERYNSLSLKEQKCIINMDQICKINELNEYEKAAIVAAKFLQQKQINSNNMKISGINVKKYRKKYYVKINYYVTDNLSESKEYVTCLDVKEDFTIGIVDLSGPDIKEGAFDRLSKICLDEYNGFSFKSEEMSLNVDKILVNINKTF